MRKLMYGLCVALVAFGSMSAEVHTDKTFLMPRSHNENLAMEYSGWHKQFRDIDEKKHGGTVQVSAFYQATTNETDLGEYFGKYNAASGPDINNPYAKTVQDFMWVTNRKALASSPLNNTLALLMDPRWLIHDADATIASDETLDVKGYLQPKHTSYGLSFAWHHKLDKLTEGLYFKVTAPVVCVKNDLHMCYTGDRLKQHLPYHDINNTKEVSLADYLGGSVEMTGTQCKLTHSKIGCDDTTCGVADVNVTLGYNFLYKKSEHVGVNVALTIPTTNEPTGEYLFEAVLGYAGHWALGMGVDCAFEFWKDEKKKQSFEFVGAVNYKYVLEATENRTLGFKYSDAVNGSSDTYQYAGQRLSMGRYFLGGKKGYTGVFPLANVLTRPVGVEPGSRVELLADLAFNHKKFTFDVGYNLFAKEAESVSVKCWPNDTYALASMTYSTADGDFDLQDAFGTYIQYEDLLPCDAATPVYVTHKVYAAMNYVWDGWKYPVMTGFGGSWEFVQGSNSAFDGYALWVKAAMTF